MKTVRSDCHIYQIIDIWIQLQDWREHGSQCVFPATPAHSNSDKRQNDNSDSDLVDDCDKRQDDLLRTNHNTDKKVDFFYNYDKETRRPYDNGDKHDLADNVTTDRYTRQETADDLQTRDKAPLHIDNDIKVQRQSVTNPLRGGKRAILILVFTQLIDSLNGRCVM